MNRPQSLHRREFLLAASSLGALGLLEGCSRPRTHDLSEAKLPAKGVSAASTVSVPAPEERIISLAKSDHVGLLELCLAEYERRGVHDYTGTLAKIERIGGTLGQEQQAHFKFLAEPFSVALHFFKNPPLGERVLYVEGARDGHMLVKIGGILGMVMGTLQKRPDDPEVLKSSLKPITRFGFQNALQELLDSYRKQQATGDLRQEFGGCGEVDGRRTVVLVRHLPSKAGYQNARTVTNIDLEWMVPVKTEGYDWNSDLNFSYSFFALRFDAGLSEKDFLPAENEMDEPRT